MKINDKKIKVDKDGSKLIKLEVISQRFLTIFNKFQQFLSPLWGYFV